MGIYINDLRELVIRPALEHLDEWSQTAENLLLGTAAQESQLGFRMQPSEHGLGIYNISAAAHTRVWDEFLVTDPELASRVRGLASQQQFLKAPHNELISNLSYASGVAWAIYKSGHLTLPDASDVHQLAQCWLNYYCPRDHQNAQTSNNPERNQDNFVQSYRNLVLRENKHLAA